MLPGSLRTGAPFPEIQAISTLQSWKKPKAQDVILGVGWDSEIKEKYGSKFSLWLVGVRKLRHPRKPVPAGSQGSSANALRNSWIEKLGAKVRAPFL